jgi:hypothetical protein
MALFSTFPTKIPIQFGSQVGVLLYLEKMIFIKIIVLRFEPRILGILSSDHVDAVLTGNDANHFFIGSSVRSGINRIMFERKMFLAGSRGADFHPEITPVDEDIVLQPRNGTDVFLMRPPFI